MTALTFTEQHSHFNYHPCSENHCLMLHVHCTTPALAWQSGKQSKFF
jgi:hypothetical protein